MIGMRFLLAACGALLIGGCGDSGATASARSSLPPPPKGWPQTLQLGLANEPGDADALAGYGAIGFRYQYLSGGVNTGRGWTRWGHGGGAYLTDYLTETSKTGVIGVISYYQLMQSRPGASTTDASEATRDLRNLRNRRTMASYWEDVRAALVRSAGHGPVVLHVEPDLWGYIQAHAPDDDPERVPAAVARSGDADLSGLPDDARGFAQAFVRLRDRYAPDVLLAYHVSPFGTTKDIHLSQPTTAEVRAMGASSAEFYRRLGADFDLLFSEFANRDAGQRQVAERDGGAAWWKPASFARFATYLGDVVRRTGRRVVLWQIPLGNTRMRAMDDTPGHWRDNRVQWLLGPGSAERRRAYLDAGVIGLLFGSPFADGTCACDARRDGVTNPPGGDTRLRSSLTADDDGGFFRRRSRRYARAGAERLP